MYELIGVATHSETSEDMVVYRELNGDVRLWVRPLAMWNEMVELNGLRVKRFTHSDEVTVPETPNGINKRSEPNEKLGLFLSPFAGHEDVFAERWESTKKNTSGYPPGCKRRWSRLCPKTSGRKVKCTQCNEQDFVPYSSAGAVEQHSRGTRTIGIYPMLPDDTCRFLVFDFDGKKEYKPDDLRRDVGIIRKACTEKGIRMAVERSRSGKGIHLWIFFDDNIPASTARKFGSSLITYAMNKNRRLPFKTYDRMIPIYVCKG